MTNEINQSYEAERKLVGWMLLCGCEPPFYEQYSKIASMVQPEHFGDELHSVIFQKVFERVRGAHSTSPGQYAQYFSDQPEFVNRGGDEYLRKLTNEGFLDDDLDAHISEILSGALRRAKVCPIDYDAFAV